MLVNDVIVSVASINKCNNVKISLIFSFYIRYLVGFNKYRIQRNKSLSFFVK